MRRHHAIVLIVPVLVVACAACTSPALSGPVTSASNQQLSHIVSEDYEVYSVLLNELYVRDGSSPIVIAELTSIDWLSAKDVKEDLAVVAQRNLETQELVNDFITKNLQPYSLRCDFKSNSACVVLSSDQVLAIGQKEDGWKVFLNKYPGQSLINLSRVGFNKGKTEALVYSSAQSGGRTGRGQYVFFTKVDNEWMIKQKVAAWAS